MAAWCLAFKSQVFRARGLVQDSPLHIGSCQVDTFSEARGNVLWAFEA